MPNQRLTIRLVPEDIGMAFGHTDDITQSEIINSMGKEFWVAMNERDAEMQACYMESRMDAHGRKLIECLHGFIELREKDE